MNAFNKITTRIGLIMLTLAIVLVATGIVVFGFLKSGAFWPAIIPAVAAIVYGCVAFVKKYYPDTNY